jgi:hypothetical protein
MEAQLETVTPQRIVHFVRSTFDGDGTPREELIAAAKRNGPEPEVVEAVDRLRRSHYRELRQIWTDLYDVPVGERPELN